MSTRTNGFRSIGPLGRVSRLRENLEMLNAAERPLIVAACGIIVRTLRTCS